MQRYIFSIKVQNFSVINCILFQHFFRPYLFVVVFIFQHLYCSHIFFINSHILSGRSILPLRVTIETQDIRIATIVGFVWVRPSREYVTYIHRTCVSYRLATFLTDIRLVLDAPLVELRISLGIIPSELLFLDFYPQTMFHREPRINQRLISP